MVEMRVSSSLGMSVQLNICLHSGQGIKGKFVCNRSITLCHVKTLQIRQNSKKLNDSQYYTKKTSNTSKKNLPRSIYSTVNSKRLTEPIML